MRTRCWSLSLRLMTISCLALGESYPYHNYLPSAFQLSPSKTVNLKCSPGLRTFCNSLRHKSFLLCPNNCKILCSTYLLIWSPNSAMCFHCQPHSISPRRNKGDYTRSHKWKELETCSNIFRFCGLMMVSPSTWEEYNMESWASK